MKYKFSVFSYRILLIFAATFLKKIEEGHQEFGIFFVDVCQVHHHVNHWPLLMWYNWKNIWAREFTIITFSWSLYLFDMDLKNFRTNVRTFCTNRKVKKDIPTWVRQKGKPNTAMNTWANQSRANRRGMSKKWSCRPTIKTL